MGENIMLIKNFGVIGASQMGSGIAQVRRSAG
jgi:3-hydroxyacyl-CoA dehydrogenase